MPDKRKATDKSSSKSGKDKSDKEKNAQDQAGKLPGAEGAVPEQKVGDTPTPPWEMPSPEQKAAAKPVTKAVAPAKTAVKKAAAPAKAGAKKKAAPILPAQRNHYVEIAAYYIAERHGFTPGREVADWAEAEAEIDRLLGGGHFNP